MVSVDKPLISHNVHFSWAMKIHPNIKLGVIQICSVYTMLLWWWFGRAGRLVARPSLCTVFLFCRSSRRPKDCTVRQLDLTHRLLLAWPVWKVFCRWFDSCTTAIAYFAGWRICSSTCVACTLWFVVRDVVGGKHPFCRCLLCAGGMNEWISLQDGWLSMRSELVLYYVEHSLVEDSPVMTQLLPLVDSGLCVRRLLLRNQLTGTVPSELGALSSLSDLCVEMVLGSFQTHTRGNELWSEMCKIVWSLLLHIHDA